LWHIVAKNIRLQITKDIRNLVGSMLPAIASRIRSEERSKKIFDHVS
jgi:hypothetical protein